MIDNLKQIHKYLIFGEDIFYYIQIIQRKKDNPDTEGADKVLHAKFIQNDKELIREAAIAEVLCNNFNARAYISLTPRSIKKFGKEFLKEACCRVCNDEWKKFLSLPEKVALYRDVRSRKGPKDKPNWIIDIDNPKHLEGTKKFMSELGIQILDTIPSVYGYHLLVRSFGIDKIKIHLIDRPNLRYRLPGGEEFDIKMDANTILYANPYMYDEKEKDL